MLGKQGAFAVPYNSQAEDMDNPTSQWVQLVKECTEEGLTLRSSARMAAALATHFNVKQDEVGLLKLEKGSLVFVHPPQLTNVGRLPLNSTNSLAVRTFNSKRAEIINNFSSIKHSTFFEMVNTGATKSVSKENLRIQKLMSAPLLDGNRAVGVVQISRKGATETTAGPDFSQTDLKNLVSAAAVLGRCFGI